MELVPATPQNDVTHQLRVAKSERRGQLALQGGDLAARADAASPRIQARPVDCSSPPPLQLHSLHYDVVRHIANAKMERRALRSPRLSQTSVLASPRSAVVTPRGRVRLSTAPVGQRSPTGTESSASGGDAARDAAFTPTGSLGLTPRVSATSPATSPPKSPGEDFITPPSRQASTRPGTGAETTVAADKSGLSAMTFSPLARRVSTRPARPLVPERVFRHKELEASIRCATQAQRSVQGALM
jgi:hypothetical protein|eukprot:COSAG02_NODE_1173_length_14105_cov_15.197701_3_plen_243_part_00